MMANSPNRPKVTERMQCCVGVTLRKGILIRNADGSWTGDGEDAPPRFTDTTVNALIVRGTLEVCRRYQVSRKPLAVKIAREPV